MTEIKLCKKCNTEKDLSEFSRNDSLGLYLKSRCKECVRKAYYETRNKKWNLFSSAITKEKNIPKD